MLVGGVSVIGAGDRANSLSAKVTIEPGMRNRGGKAACREWEDNAQ